MPEESAERIHFGEQFPRDENGALQFDTTNYRGIEQHSIPPDLEMPLREQGKIERFVNIDEPEAIRFGRELRRNLKERIDAANDVEGIPELPAEIPSLESFFVDVRSVVSDRWNQVNGDVMKAATRRWRAELSDDPATAAVRELLADEKRFEERFRTHQFSSLESLRKVHPVAWQSLLAASSERQLAEVVVAKAWLKQLDDDQIRKFGFTRPELTLLVDLAPLMGKYVDQAYMKQVALADMPSGSAPSRNVDEEGQEYVYDVQKNSRRTETKSYAEVFPFEFKGVVRHLRRLAARVDTQVHAIDMADSLPNTYALLPHYLRKMADRYESSETDLEALNDAWEDLYRDTSNLALSGCPIIFVPQGDTSVAGDAGKVDVELRIGVQTPETRKLGKATDVFRNGVNRLNKTYSDALEEPRIVARMIYTLQPFAFGPNIQKMTQGESGEGTVMVHTNATEDMAKEIQIPLLYKAFGIPVEENAYAQAAKEENGLHELAHEALPEDDEKIHKKLGVSEEANIIEELKAETVGALLFEQAYTRGKTQFKPDIQFLAKVGTLCDYVTEKAADSESGKRYYTVGVILLDRLLTEGVIKKDGEKYTISDARKGFQVLAEIGEEILQLYAKPSTGPSQIKAFVNGLARAESNATLQEFIKSLR